MKLLRFRYELVLAALIICSSVLFFRNLGQPNLTMWDEVVHANVIKNLAQHCCTPTLLNQNWGTNYQDWTNTTTWLHKPLLPFYISAVFYKIHPSTLAIRLPALICFELLLLLVYFIGRRYFSPATGLAATALLAFNIYSYQLVQGTEFSGLGDLGFALFVLCGVAVMLENFRNPKKLWFVLLGLSIVGAYFFKGGLVLIPFGILGLITLWQEKFITAAKNLALSAIIILIPVGLVSLFLSHRFGIYYSHEQQMQMAHLWQAVEGWGRPWDYYLTIYGPAILGSWIMPPFLFSVFYNLLNFKKHKQLFVFSSIILGFFIPLSFAISKVPNFIFTTLPLAALLIAGTVHVLWQEKKYKTICVMALSSILMYILLRFDLWFVKEYLLRIVKVPERLLIIEISAAVLLAAALLTLIFQKLIRPLGVKILIILAIILVAWSNFHANKVLAIIPDPTTLSQQYLRNVAANLKASPDSVILINIPELYRSNLYFNFWSNLPALEVDQNRTVNYWLKIIPKNHPVYLISVTKTVRIK